jgi:hypothetical protein
VPRAMDPRLVMAHERANPATCYMVDVAVPDVGQVLRRAADQFLGAAARLAVAREFTRGRSGRRS